MVTDKKNDKKNNNNKMYSHTHATHNAKTNEMRWYVMYVPCDNRASALATDSGETMTSPGFDSAHSL